MSDLGIIIPVAIVAVIALALGSSSGVNPDQFDDWELDTPMDYARKLSIYLVRADDPHSTQYDKARGSPPKLFACVFKRKTEIRLNNATKPWKI